MSGDAGEAADEYFDVDEKQLVLLREAAKLRDASGSTFARQVLEFLDDTFGVPGDAPDQASSSGQTNRWLVDLADVSKPLKQLEISLERIEFAIRGLHELQAAKGPSRRNLGQVISELDAALECAHSDLDEADAELGELAACEPPERGAARLEPMPAQAIRLTANDVIRSTLPNIGSERSRADVRDALVGAGFTPKSASNALGKLIGAQVLRVEGDKGQERITLIGRWP